MQVNYSLIPRPTPFCSSVCQVEWKHQVEWQHYVSRVKTLSRMKTCWNRNASSQLCQLNVSSIILPAFCSAVAMLMKTKQLCNLECKWDSSFYSAAIELCYFALQKYQVTWFCDINVAAPLCLLSKDSEECYINWFMTNEIRWLCCTMCTYQCLIICHQVVSDCYPFRLL